MTKAAVGALSSIHEDLWQIMSSLTDDDWQRPSACAGWSVHDVVAHITSNLRNVASRTLRPNAPGPDASGLSLTVDEAREALVVARRDWQPSQLLAEYEEFVDQWMSALRQLQAEPTASELAPIADHGRYPRHLLADAFAFDHYCHLRLDIVAPGGPIAAELAPPTERQLRPAVAWMLAAMPNMQREALAIVTKPLRLTLTGPGGGTWAIEPGHDGPVTVVADEGSTVTAATVTSAGHDFVSWATRRSPWRPACAIDGDKRYAAKVLDVIDVS